MNLPAEIQNKIELVHEQVNEIVAEAYSNIVTDISGEVRFKYAVTTASDVLTDFERAQSVSFVTRYDALPMIETVSVEEFEGKLYFGNMGEARHVLNEFRSIIQNKKDSIHYQQVHRFCREKLINMDQSKGLSIKAEHIDGSDVTDSFVQLLNEHNKAIKSILKNCEFDYIYNGILQHSDHRFTKRFWSEYSSGELNYVFMKHTIITRHIHELLRWHYYLFSVLTFPKLGPL
ncbi:hypothetical protein ACTJ28_003703 [Vibrio alginolyticus]